MKYIFRKAILKEVPFIYSLYEKRIKWMDEKGIKQWNVSDYLTIFPETYFLNEIDKLYCLVIDNKIVGALILLEKDTRWQNDKEAYYIHNLVTDTNYRGVGKIMINEVETLARQNNKVCVRLDCAEDNIFLNNYYENLGYLKKGYCEVGVYKGITREKIINI